MLTTDKYFLGLDIGASSIKFGWGNCKQGVQGHGKRLISSKTLSSLKNTVTDILECVRKNPGLDKIHAIGIGTPGTIDRSSGLITGINPNLPFWVEHSPAELIPRDLNIPVYYDNDANLMCLAEAFLRGAKGRVAGITVGSGIGCGYVEDGRIYHGAHGFAMELGHISSVPKGARCNCGRQGCLEAYASVDGILRRLEPLIPNASGVFAKSGISGLKQLAISDPQVAQLITDGQEALARGVSDLCILLDPDTVVIGGGAMDGRLYDWEALKNKILEYMPPLNSQNTSLELALEGNRAGVLGAVILAELNRNGV